MSENRINNWSQQNTVVIFHLIVLKHWTTLLGILGYIHNWTILILAALWLAKLGFLLMPRTINLAAWSIMCSLVLLVVSLPLTATSLPSLVCGRPSSMNINKAPIGRILTSENTSNSMFIPMSSSSVSPSVSMAIVLCAGQMLESKERQDSR